MKLPSQFASSETNDRATSPACVGVFDSTESAILAVRALRSIGVEDERISVFAPGPRGQSLSAVETTDTEQGGMGAAMAGSILGALGLGIGAILFIPAIGPISVLGALAAGLMGAGSAAAGAAVGSMLERKSLEGLLPVDEIYVYEDALAQGRTIVCVTPENDLAGQTMEILKDAGAESIDAAKQGWSVGLRDHDELNYNAPDKKALWDKALCREGFAAGMRHEALGMPESQGKAEIIAQLPQVSHEKAFWNGYSDGRAYERSRELHHTENRN